MEVLKLIQQSKEIHIPYGKMTHMPYLTCDEKTYNDQIWVFTQKAAADAYAKRREEVKIPVVVRTLENTQFLDFYLSLYSVGVNEVVLVHGDKIAKVPLKLIVSAPDYTKIPEERRPVMNPQLQLSALYYLQEFRRPVPLNEKKNLLELEEEMAVNMCRATYMMAVVPDGKDENGAPRVQVATISTQQGVIYQPIFTDAAEFMKFNKENRFTAIKVDLKDLETLLTPIAKGIAVNPMGFNYVLLRELLPQLMKRFT